MPIKTKNFIIIIFVMIAVLFCSNAIAADKKTPILNKIFHIDTEGKCKKTKNTANVKTGKAGERPAAKELLNTDGDDNREDSEKLYVELGDAYTKSKLYKSAIEAYENALRINPDNADAHFNVGLLYEHYLKDTEKAIYHMKKCIKTAPSPKKAEEAKYYLDILRSGKDWEVSSY
jgi:tetratricopeptide (TPR) repeat protein